MNKLTILLIGAAVATSAMAEQYVFPKNGQTPEQQKKDEYDCHTWAVQQTGYDPVAAAQQTPTTTVTTTKAAPVTASPVKGAARGAAIGAATGAIAGDAGKGAAIGATAGAMGGAFRRADQRKAAVQQQVVQTQASTADLAKRQEEYQKARSVCLDAKGYAVK